MSRLLAALRSRWLRVGFVVLAVAAAVVAVVRQWDEILPALRQMPLWVVGAALVASVVQLLLTMFSWRAVMRDLGSALPFGHAFGIFFVSQLGKYVPGGVWNVVAASELGADHQIPRRRSLSGMAVTLLISIVSGLAVAAPAIALSADPTAVRYRWIWVLLPVVLALLVPAVLNRILALGMRLMRREPLEHALTTKGTLTATVWSVAAWLAAGLQVWLLGTAVGMSAGPVSYVLVAGAFALAWVVGFLVVVAPAGLGAREVVLLALLSAQVGSGAVLVIVLVSRLVLTAADLATSAAGFAVLRAGRRSRA